MEWSDLMTGNYILADTYVLYSLIFKKSFLAFTHIRKMNGKDESPAVYLSKKRADKRR